MISDIRKTVLETINEVRLKQNVNEITSVSADSYGVVLLNYLNDVVSFISDQGDWLEQINPVTVIASSSVSTYSVVTSGVVKNIHDMYFTGTRNEMKNVGYDQIRRNSIAAPSYGQPYQYCLVGTDTNGNPIFQTYPTPGPNEAGETFNITVFMKPPLYTGSDANTVVPFDSRLTVKGLLALAMLDESTGAPTSHYQVLADTFADENFQVYARFRGNTGNEMLLMPMRQRYRRR